jgi:DNA-directed RNA polymerase subunit E'/Rpb7
MEQTVLFEQKIHLSPKDLNRVAKESVDSILLHHLQEKLENKCSQHGFVIPGSLEILSRSMGQLENGTYTGNIIYHVQTQGRVYNPANGTRVTGTVLRRNKMGLYVIYKDAIRILVPRDLHIGNQEFEAIEPDQSITIEIRKSRFQIHDPFILSIGIYIGPGTEQPATIPSEPSNMKPVFATEESDGETESSKQNVDSPIEGAMSEPLEEEETM